MRGREFSFFKKIMGSALLFGITLPAWSSAFQMLEQNVSNMGTSYAGTAALAEDASTNHYNTAGLTHLNNEQLVVGGVLLLPHTSLNVTKATTTFGAPLSPSSGNIRPSNDALLPLLHYAKRINDRWMFGFSADVPFGSKINYPNNALPRYSNTRSEMKTVDLAPSLAYEFDHGFSLGAGVDFLYMLVKSDLRIGTGNLDTDGLSESTADNWGVGYHIGGLYEVDDYTRFGIQYHSKITVKTKGYTVTQYPVFLPATRKGNKADVHLPEYATLSAYHAFDEKWAIMADLAWTHWKQYKQLIIKFDDNTQLINNENYKNSYRVSVGGTYQYNELWRFRFGVMFDESPVPDANRNLFIPNQNQIVPAIGAQYRICKNIALDFGYAHVFFKKDNNLNVPAPTAVNTTQGLQNVQGSIKNRLDAVGLQLTWDIVP